MCSAVPHHTTLAHSTQHAGSADRLPQLTEHPVKRKREDDGGVGDDDVMFLPHTASMHLPDADTARGLHDLHQGLD